MSGSLTVGVFEIFVYIIPGLLAVLCACILCRGFSWLDFENPHASKIILLSLASFIAGVGAHICALVGQTSIHILSGRKEGASVIEEHIEAFNEFSLEGMQEPTGKPFKDQAAFYRYAEAFVKEKSTRQVDSLARLTAMSLFCRNSILPAGALIVVLCFSARSVKQDNKHSRFMRHLLCLLQSRWWFVSLLSLFPVLAILITGYKYYRAAAINLVLRSYLVLSAG